MRAVVVEFLDDSGTLVLRYVPRDGTSWVHDRLARDGLLTIKKTFHLRPENVVAKQSTPEREDERDVTEEDVVDFRVASREGDYFKFDSSILDVECDVLIHKDVRLSYKLFTAEQKISIFKMISELRPARIVVGGMEPDAIPEATFRDLVSNFPSGHELKRYALARVSAVLREFLDSQVDAESLFRHYVERRLSKKVQNFHKLFKEDEIRKHTYLHEKLSAMLTAESGYTESAWQAEILQIILLLNPKYIKAIREAPVKDTYSDVLRKIDILLIDSSGHVDIVEIKQPFDKCIITNNQYRDNFIPLRDLSGTVMQIEKYVFYLNKWGRGGEDYLTRRYSSELPADFSIKITNPGGIVIMGRDVSLTSAQKHDFEVIKRKYKNIIDIVTYDDLLRRLKFTIQQLGAG